MLPGWVDSFIAQPIYDRWTSFFDIYPIQAGDTVFLGDSITEGGKWDEMFPEAHIKNRGILADTSSGVLARLTQITSGKPSKVFINIGTNDIGGMVANISDTELLQNYEEILDQLAKETPDTLVYVQSLFPRTVKFTQQIEAVNSKLQSLALSKGVTYVNLYPHFLDDDGSMKDELSNDELHLLGNGYAMWRDLIYQHVKE